MYKHGLLAVTAALASASAGSKMPNIGYLGAGYDIFRGNPHAIGRIDPGFKESVIEYDYNGLKTADDVYEIPDGTQVRRCDACQLTWETTEISGSNSYHESLEVDVEFELKGFGASFSASTDYKTVHDTTSEHSSVVTSSQARCLVYCGTLVSFPPFKPSGGLMLGIKSLTADYDPAAYFKFIDNFGTHVTKSVAMGGTFGQQSTVTKEAWTKMTETDLNIKTAASASAWGVTASASTMTDQQKKDAEAFSKNCESQKIFTVGGQPPADGKAQTWVSNAVEEPMPIQYTLMQMDDFIDTYVDGADPAVVQNMAKALTEFCPALLAKGKIDSCDPPAPDPPLPGGAQGCRICADSCGGSYPSEVGSMSDDQNWPGWFNAYPSGCDGAYGVTDYSNSMKMCCSANEVLKESSNSTESSNSNNSSAASAALGGSAGLQACRFCADECGSDFPKETGGMSVDQNWPHWFQMYRPQCLDGYRQGSYNSYVKFCCQEEPACAYCSSCGGDFPAETGSMGRDKGDWQGWFEQFDNQCGGTYDHHGYQDGVKLCCKK